MQAIRLIVGLGNPGGQYEQTRHNAGFWLLDNLAYDFKTQFSLEPSFFGELAKARLQGETVFLLKPATFMNLSGKAVQSVAHYFKIKPEEILVAHDELDIPPGQIKLKWAGGHAGHNGLRSIQSCLGTNNYWRLRIGIGHPRDSQQPQQPVVDYVLGRPSASEMTLIEGTIDRARLAVVACCQGDGDKASRLLSGK